ncbi:MAG: methyltransferase [Oscillospiraceae bacterium]
MCVSKEHRFGTDAFLLSDFASPRKKDLVCDLGTGCGIIPLIMAKRFVPKKIYGVDIQPEAIEQFNLSLEKSVIQSEIVPICADLKDLFIDEKSEFDLITCNPPYKAENSGILSQMSAQQIARHEVLCTIDDICKTASTMLKYGGRLCFCQRPERLADVITSMKNANIEPKLLRFVAKCDGAAPWLFLIEGKKGSKPFMKVLPTLTMYDKSGELTPEIKRIYSKLD